MLRAVTILAIMFAATLARAQQADDWVAPVAVTLASPVAPANLSLPTTAVVTLRFTVNASGRATDVTATAASDPRLVNAARDAVLSSWFAPARFRGQPRAVVAELDVEFAATASAPAAAPAAIAGVVYERGTRFPVPAAQIALFGRDDVVAADAAGRFRLALPPGAVTVVVAAPGYLVARYAESVSAGELLRVEYRLTPAATSPLELRIEAERERAEVSRVRLDARELRSAPGTLDDTIRVVQTLPGVALQSDLSGALLIRGSDDRDTRIYVDGILVPFVFHFGALKSIIVSDLVQETVLYPSNFSVRYGDAIGGVLDVRLRDPDTRAWRGRVQVTSLLSEAAAEGPLTARTSVQVAARRSYLDAFLNAVLPESTGANFNVVPRFADYQLRLVHRRGPLTLRAFAFGARDAAELLVDEDRLIDPTLFNYFRYGYDFDNVGAAAAYGSAALTGTTLVAGSAQQLRGNIGRDDRFRTDDRELTARSDWEYAMVPRLTWAAGVDSRWRVDRTTVRLPRPPRPGEFDYDFLTEERLDVSERTPLARVGLYVEARPGKPGTWHGALGARLNVDGRTRVVTVDPRGLMFVPAGAVGEFKAGLGIYHQYNVGMATAAPPVGNPDAGPNRALHALVGWERQLPWSLRASLEGYAKWIDALISENPDPFAAPRFDNWGQGRAWGVEASLRKPLSDAVLGWISYSFARSFRTAFPGEPETPFDFDRPHILNAVVTWIPTRRWEAGAALRYASGQPFDRVVTALYVADLNAWYPITKRGSERFPDFVRLDLRGKHTFLFDTWNLAVLLEILNATMADNPIGVNYNADYTQRVYLNSFPILPYLGVEASF